MAVVRKIIEKTLAAGATTVTFTDSDIPNSLIRLYSTDPDLMPVTQTISGTTLTVTYEAQSASKGVALEIVKQGLEIVDNVTSTDADKALSAKQGKTLKDLIDGITVTGSLSELDDVNITDPTTDDILIYDGVEDEWINTSMPSIPSDIDDLGDVDIIEPSNGQILSYDNGAWINTNAPSGGGVDYSTSEQDTGLKWIDGKSIYQCSYNPQQTFSIGSTWTNIIPLSGIETLINLQLTLQIDIENRLRWEYYQGYLKAVSISGSVSLPNPVITIQYTKEVI